MSGQYYHRPVSPNIVWVRSCGFPGMLREKEGEGKQTRVKDTKKQMVFM